MRNLSNLGRGVALAALLAVTATPAIAGKEDRAKQAIAEAEGKIDAAEKAGTGGEVPGLVAQANEALRAAREDLRADHNTAAIQAASRASTLADTAIGVANKRRAENEAATAARTDAAQQQAAAAQDAAAMANDRAAAAETSAAVANAQADALRNQPPAPTVATVTTTETTKHTASSAPAKRKVVRRTTTRPTTRAATATEKTTTTTVSTAPANGSY